MSASSHGTADAVQSVPGGEFRLGELLVGEGLVTQSQLNEALHWQREHGGYTPLGQVLVKRKMLTRRRAGRGAEWPLPNARGWGMP